MVSPVFNQSFQASKGTFKRCDLATLALLLLIGASFFAFPVPSAPVIVNTVGAVLFGLGYIWLGYTLWTDTSKAIAAETGFSPAV